MRNAQTFLHMETLPLWVGNVLFADGNVSFAHGDVLFTYGNVAARMFGRAHRPAPTISHVAPCPKIAGEVFADRQR